MLAELRIENFAIIDQLELELDSSLITFTGETGAGKSIIIDAVETLLGGRAEAGMVRSGAERAVVEGVFRIPEATKAELHTVLEREDLLDDPDYLTVGREIRSNGRSTARINGRSVNASLLKEIGEYLIDVHGQSEHLSLLRPSQHLNLLDSYAGSGELLADYRKYYSELLEVRRELKELRLAERDAARRMDMLTYQIEEIDAARLRPGEEEELKEERNRLANAEGLASLAQEALQVLDEGEPETPAVTDLFGQLIRALNGLARLDPSQAALSEDAEGLFDGLTELSRSLRAYLEAIEFNPKRLDQVEERLALIHSLERKYGESIEAILAFADEARKQLDTITHSAARIEELEEREIQLLKRLGQQGMALSEKRREMAEKLSRAIENELNDLHMSQTRFDVKFEQREDPEGAPVEDGRRLAFDGTGLERVEFLIAPNPGEGLKPLAKIASGGETSRLMLALKNVLVNADHVPTLIFDEIDQGIGGRVGAIVGQKLWQLAHRHQVLCITHLPQLAAYGSQHYHVHKNVEGGRTTTQVSALKGEKRVLELAQMFGEVSEGTLQSANDMLAAVGRRTAGEE